MAEWIQLATRAPQHLEEVFVRGVDCEIAYVRADLNDPPEFWRPLGVDGEDWLQGGLELAFAPVEWQPGPFGRRG